MPMDTRLCPCGPVQIGAFDIKREAQRQLSSADAKAGHVLDNADLRVESHGARMSGR
jgi:hypothetical protein